ncbi:hypothetical protein HPB49_003601 [Dermacentor silvarum]|uniref:Uncharacterized protein n=1 Tax=Dermacentor silvarum TaxID=543639 RepID=A0ACB8D2N6_DERSI|nr:hypothetical protein HPB49_003601 [Dermacentor silvarum]
MDVRRNKIKLWSQGIPQRETCRLTEKSISAVNRIIQSYRNEDGRLKDAARSGRHRCTSEESDLLIVAAVIIDPFQSARQTKTALNLQASEETIRTRMRELVFVDLSRHKSHTLPSAKNAGALSLPGHMSCRRLKNGKKSYSQMNRHFHL